MDEAAARALFDANARTYDRVNTVISLGLDSHWRAWAARRAVARPGARVLDAFAGTGLVGLRAARRGADVTLADASPGMLEMARARAAAAHLPVRTIECDLTGEPLMVPGAPFDAITVVFGVRYLDDPVRVLRALAGLLSAGGSIVVVEFVEPGPSVISRVAGWYFFGVLPRLAGLLSGHRELYETLASTTHAMGRADRLEAIVSSAGLEVTGRRSMGFGLVQGLVASPAHPGGG